MPFSAIRLVVPARREALGIVRAVTGAAANSCGLGFDRVEEARLAVNEAAALLIGDGGSASLTCRLLGADRLEVVLEADPGPQQWPPHRWSESLEHSVFSAVTEEFELTTATPPGVRLSFTTGT